MHSRLQNLPTSFFSTIMCLSGLAIALQRAGDLWSPSAELGDFVALLSMLAFTVLVLFTIIIYRMIFHHPFPDKLLPTLFILLAPPAIGFISYVKLTGGLDGFGRVLYFSALLLTLLLFMQVPRFLRLPFYLSRWAYSFPLAAMTVATLVLHDLTRFLAYEFLGWLLLGILYAVFIYLVARTLYAISHHQICVEAH